MMEDLQNFYQEVSNDSVLTHRLESITDQKNFTKLVTQLGAKKGYDFTAADVEDSIKDHTASGQGDYFCVPVGCWRNPKVSS